MTSQTWKFFRAGGFDQVKLESGNDFLALGQLDQKLWVALACPTTGLEFDETTLALIDTDKDGRIRAPELVAAIDWAGKCLKNPNDLLKCSPELPLSAFNTETSEGKQLLAAAKQILTNLGRPDATAITLADTADTARIFAQTKFNGDGLVPADSATDEATAAVINDIIACLGGEPDRSGKPGVNQAKVDQFFGEAQAYSDWWAKAEADPSILPLGNATGDADAALQAIRPKVDDYFARCRLAAFDPRAANALNREEKEYLAVAAKDLTITSAEIAGFPLAQVSAGKPLPLQGAVNPAWADGLARFHVQVVNRLLSGNGSLTEAEWLSLRGKFAAYEAWGATKSGAVVEKLGIDRIREILAGRSKETISALIAQDKMLESEANSIALVERLIRYHRDLFTLVNNFVSFRDFYSRKNKAIFQAGTLYLDQRSCDLCLTVDDPGRHALLAGMAGAYLAYCDCTRKATGEKKQIVAAFTGGDSDNLMVGRNGLFYDRKGRDWDATITKIVDNPISIRQAFWAPYKKLVRMIEERVAKRAAAAEAAKTAGMDKAAAGVATADKQKPGEVAKPKIDTGTLAAIGLVLATLLAALAGIFGAIARLPAWQVPLAIAGIILAISLPSIVLAYLKLRKRNLGPILDANGWAINARARINVPFGGALTQVATLPPGAERDLADPFAEKKRPWALYITLLVILVVAASWALGKFDSFLPEKATSSWVIHGKAAEPQPPPLPAPEKPGPAEPAK